MATIDKVVKLFTVQTAVYWANPQSDGFGGTTFDAPQEIKVRWDVSTEVAVSDDGEEFVSKAEVLVRQDMKMNEYLFLGTLNDLDSGDYDNPENIQGAYRIKRFEKVPMPMKNDEFVRKVWL